MPNPLDVYLHDTPAKELFERTHRFFSHGCIRVENPQDLALRLLRHDAAWTTEALAAAVSARATRRVPIDPIIEVFVLYFTAMVEPGGDVAFRDDVYHRDPPLIGALFPDKPASSGERRASSQAGCGPAQARGAPAAFFAISSMVDLDQGIGAALAAVFDVDLRAASDEARCSTPNNGVRSHVSDNRRSEAERE